MFRRLYAYATSNIGFYFGLFVAVWLIAWACNGLYKTAFQLDKLEELGKFVLAKFVTDSTVNTRIGSLEVKQQ